ncbi:hypothetical protein INS49_001593 [Diaporthe citri]|uniref:uncharacterized protein n=1 Tax=Diaporthe citri TaxID=83186 RepID=UPI001C7FC87A|nr:uncharacterized protein INS49_001593 [Diaporthe citri]KAG6367404.1 hypothetical protein INS49_001593 [Diaporthe citri]
MHPTPGAQSERPARFQLRRARPLAEYSHMSAPTNFEHNQEAYLYGNNLDSSTAFREHDRPWISIPAQAIRTAQLGFIACGVHGIVLASFWVLVLIAYGVLWKPGAWFLVPWAALCLIGFLLSFTIDQASRRRSNSRRMWMTYASILPMLFQIVSVLRYKTRFASSFLYGHLMANLLLGPALVCLSNGLSHEIFPVPSANQLRSMMSFGLTGILGMLAWVHLSRHRDSNFSQTSKTIFSITALVVITGLFLWTVTFRTRTHVNLWHHEQPEAEYEAERPWPNEFYGSYSDTLLLDNGSIAIFATMLAIPCSYAVISASKDPHPGSYMSEDLLSVILLPMLANTPVFLLGMRQAARKHLDEPFELNHAVGVEFAYIMTAIILIKSITFNVQVPFESNPADLVFLGVASITSHRSFSSHCQPTYMDGALCLGLYLIIALAVLIANAADAGHL